VLAMQARAHRRQVGRIRVGGIRHSNASFVKVRPGRAAFVRSHPRHVGPRMA
jgi:hypothetical protein